MTRAVAIQDSKASAIVSITSDGLDSEFVLQASSLSASSLEISRVQWATDAEVDICWEGNPNERVFLLPAGSSGDFDLGPYGLVRPSGESTGSILIGGDFLSSPDFTIILHLVKR